MSYLVDSHCHLDYPELAGDLDGVMARARNAGVGHLLTIGTKLSAFPGVLAAAERYPNVSCTVGIHPHDAATETADDIKHLIEISAHPKVVAFGETGLDFFYDHSPREQQERSFRTHLSAARKVNLPVVVHTRDADDDTARVLADEAGKGAIHGVIHCFSSSQQLADIAIGLGFYISISGIVTFKKADALREIVKSVPLERLLVETDSPYLAPVPYRGKSNEPAYVAKTAAVVAELKGISISELAQQTTANFFRLFAKAVPVESPPS